MVHLPLPDEMEIKKMVAEKKKKELLKLMERYESNDLLQKQSEAKAMLNIRCEMWFLIERIEMESTSFCSYDLMFLNSMLQLAFLFDYFQVI